MNSPTNRALPHIKVYTDGACSGNPGPGGWAYLMVWQGPNGPQSKEGSGGHRDTTNNRMELTAPMEALKALTQPCVVDVYTDSQYVQKGMTEWLAGWVRKGWKNSQNKPVENRPQWEALAAEAKRHTVRWHWVKGHAGHPENERVDELAVAAIPRP